MAWATFDLGEAINQAVTGMVTLAAVMLGARYGILQLRHERALDRRLKAREDVLAAVDNYISQWWSFMIFNSTNKNPSLDERRGVAAPLRSKAWVVHTKCRAASRLGVQDLKVFGEQHDALENRLDEYMDPAFSAGASTLLEIKLISMSLQTESELIHQAIQDDLGVGNAFSRWRSRRGATERLRVGLWLSQRARANHKERIDHNTDASPSPTA